jgi:hypothetical protein
MIPFLLAQLQAPTPVPVPGRLIPWDAPGTVLVIGAIGVLILNIIAAVSASVLAYLAKAQSATNEAKIAENTQLTAEAKAQGGEIKSLVDGTQSKLLEKLEAAQTASNQRDGEIRALHGLVSTLAQQLSAVVPVAAVANGKAAEKTVEAAELLAQAAAATLIAQTLNPPKVP